MSFYFFLISEAFNRKNQGNPPPPKKNQAKRQDARWNKPILNFSQPFKTFIFKLSPRGDGPEVSRVGVAPGIGQSRMFYSKPCVGVRWSSVNENIKVRNFPSVFKPCFSKFIFPLSFVKSQFFPMQGCFFFGLGGKGFPVQGVWSYFLPCNANL